MDEILRALPGVETQTYDIVLSHTDRERPQSQLLVMEDNASLSSNGVCDAAHPGRASARCAGDHRAPQVLCVPKARSLSRTRA